MKKKYILILIVVVVSLAFVFTTMCGKIPEGSLTANISINPNAVTLYLGGEAKEVTVQNNSDKTAKTIRITNAPDEIEIRYSNCDSVEPGQVCTIKLNATNKYLKDTTLTIQGENTSIASLRLNIIYENWATIVATSDDMNDKNELILSKNAEHLIKIRNQNNNRKANAIMTILPQALRDMGVNVSQKGSCTELSHDETCNLIVTTGRTTFQSSTPIKIYGNNTNTIDIYLTVSDQERLSFAKPDCSSPGASAAYLLCNIQVKNLGSLPMQYLALKLGNDWGTCISFDPQTKTIQPSETQTYEYKLNAATCDPSKIALTFEAGSVFKQDFTGNALRTQWNLKLEQRVIIGGYPYSESNNRVLCDSILQWLVKNPYNIPLSFKATLDLHDRSDVIEKCQPHSCGLGYNSACGRKAEIFLNSLNMCSLEKTENDNYILGGNNTCTTQPNFIFQEAYVNSSESCYGFDASIPISCPGEKQIYCKADAKLNIYCPNCLDENSNQFSILIGPAA